jgi:hypothetical protein
VILGTNKFATPAIMASVLIQIISFSELYWIIWLTEKIRGVLGRKYRMKNWTISDPLE